MEQKAQKTILIAGASGFIGRSLIEKILDTTSYKIIALSRAKKESHHPNLEWRQCDLFSLLEVEGALEGATDAIYLVHSMLPSAHLDQGSFEDYDLLLADNFARACEKNNIQDVIYLGGIIPDNKKISRHLRSRQEVEEVLENHSFKFTALRAGLILGKGGSSFNILLRLVKKLPFMLCPPWTSSPMTPIALDDTITCLTYVLQNPQVQGKVYDIGGPKTYTYIDLMHVLSKKLGRNSVFLKVPFNFMWFSRYWVRLLSGASKELVYPLLESLKTPMSMNLERTLLNPNEFKSYEDTLDELIDGASEVKYTPSRFTRKYVRSVQRLPLPKGKNAQWVAVEYMRWLPNFLSPFLKVRVENDRVLFCLFSKSLCLLELKYSPDRSFNDRRLFYIVGGLLAKDQKQDQSKGRLEFRETIDQKYIITAIHDFYPALPWYIYRFSQAIVHLFVMRRFGKHLENVEDFKFEI
jgi:uncharacterized protein YbjT (DUF2867 family)